MNGAGEIFDSLSEKTRVEVRSGMCIVSRSNMDMSSRNGIVLRNTMSNTVVVGGIISTAYGEINHGKVLALRVRQTVSKEAVSTVSRVRRHPT